MLFQHIPSPFNAHEHRYNQHPTQDDLINAISISRQWSIHSLYGYAIDHFKRQFVTSKIHPAVVLGVARRFGIPQLINRATEALARPEIPFSSWAKNPDVIRHVSIDELAIIGRMKEKILLARMALCTVPPVVHNYRCAGDARVACTAAWRGFWMGEVVPKLCTIDEKIGNQLWWIRCDSVEKAQISGMTGECREMTVDFAIDNAGWKSEDMIPRGAAMELMVPERDMLEPLLEVMDVEG